MRELGEPCGCVVRTEAVPRDCGFVHPCKGIGTEIMRDLDQPQTAPFCLPNFIQHARIIGIWQRIYKALHTNDLQPQIWPQPESRIFIELEDQFP